MKDLKEKLLPLTLTAFVILIDQITKFLIVKHIPLPYYGDDPEAFFQIIHVRNKAIAFSLGENLPEQVKPFLFIIIPLLVLGFLTWYYLNSNEFVKLQRWAVAGIIGGGIGNIIDRIFRPDGVVDFVSVRIYGLFGWERWPTFNLADSAVVVCCIMLFITIIIYPHKEIGEETNEQKN